MNIISIQRHLSCSCTIQSFTTMFAFRKTCTQGKVKKLNCNGYTFVCILSASFLGTTERNEYVMHLPEWGLTPSLGKVNSYTIYVELITTEMSLCAGIGPSHSFPSTHSQAIQLTQHQCAYSIISSLKCSTKYTCWKVWLALYYIRGLFRSAKVSLDLGEGSASGFGQTGEHKDYST